MAQQTLDNSAALSEQRGKINNNALDALSKSDTTTQPLASDVDFVAGKGVSFGGGVALNKHEPGIHTATITPSGTGSITLNSTNNKLYYDRIGGRVNVNGELQIGSVSAPIGTYVLISIPFVISDTSGLSGRTGGCVGTIISTANNPKIYHGLEGVAEFRIYLDPATLAANDRFLIDISFHTDAA